MNTYAIIEAGGEQLRVEPGRFYDARHFASLGPDSLGPNTKILLYRVLMIRHGSSTSLGHPWLPNATVKGRILHPRRDEKVTIYKMRPKKKTRRKIGHRQIYGKGGIGKSTTSCNISIALARRGKRVLQIGCDPKHDSTFTLTGFLIPTIIDTLQSKDYHYEDVWPEDVIYKGYGDVDCVEAGGPPAGAGCGGYVVGETVKLLKELNAFYEYDVILFDVLGDVVCGGFAAPLNYADYCIIITDNGFDALFAANRIAASVREKARTHPLRLAGLVGNRTSKRDLIDKYVEACPMPVLEVLPLIEDIRVSRVKGKTLFEMAESEPNLRYVCEFYLNIADQILSQPEGVVPKEVPDRELFSLLSDFYLNPTSSGIEKNSEESLDFMMV
eukprot:SM000460S16113  [mRNA]  locus=s460:14568:16093:- [translate_table: standard]